MIKIDLQNGEYEITGLGNDIQTEVMILANMLKKKVRFSADQIFKMVISGIEFGDLFDDNDGTSVMVDFDDLKKELEKLKKENEKES